MILPYEAVAVLLGYSLTSLAAIRLAPEQRLFPLWVAWRAANRLVLSFKCESYVAI